MISDPTPGATRVAEDEVSGSRSPRSRAARAAYTLWCVLAGYFLLLAPWGEIVWNDRFFADQEALRRLLFWPQVRFGIAAVGALLLLAAAWEIVTWLQPRGGRAEP